MNQAANTTRIQRTIGPEAKRAATTHCEDMLGGGGVGLRREGDSPNREPQRRGNPQATSTALVFTQERSGVVADVVGTEQEGTEQEGSGRYHTLGDGDNPSCRVKTIEGPQTGGAAEPGMTCGWQRETGRAGRRTPMAV